MILDEMPPGDNTVTWMKTRVPASDRRIVLSAIDNKMNATKVAWREKYLTDEERNFAKVDFFIDCIEKTGTSLKHQILEATVPDDDASVEGPLDSFKMRCLRVTTDRDDKDDDSLSSSSIDDVDKEISFEDSDIVDQEAYDQVRRLRAQAREISSRVIAIRAETTERALDMTTRDLSELLRVHGLSQGGTEDQSKDISEEVEDGAEQSMDSMNPMNAALRTLASSLQNVDSELTEKLEALKETIGTIESSVEKYQRLLQGDVSALSQTEKALLAVDRPVETAVCTRGKTESPMNPDEKLACLLAGFL